MFYLVLANAVVSSHSNTLAVSSKTIRPTKRISSNGTMSKNGMSWRRRQTNEGLEVEDEVPVSFLRSGSDILLSIGFYYLSTCIHFLSLYIQIMHYSSKPVLAECIGA